MIASLQLFAAIAQRIAKQSIQPSAASAMALEKNTKKHRMLGTKERSYETRKGISFIAL